MESAKINVIIQKILNYCRTLPNETTSLYIGETIDSNQSMSERLMNICKIGVLASSMEEAQILLCLLHIMYDDDNSFIDSIDLINDKKNEIVTIAQQFSVPLHLIIDGVISFGDSMDNFLLRNRTSNYI